MAKHSQFIEGPMPPISSGNRPEGFEHLISGLVLAWANFDTSLLELMVNAFELKHDEGRILIGNMDMRNRITKVKTLFAHLGMPEGVGLMAQIADEVEHFVHPRNVVCHVGYLGTLEGEPIRLAFGPYKPHVGHIGLTVHTIGTDYIEASIKYARHWEGVLWDFAQALREGPPQSQGEDRPPSPPE